MHCTPCEKRWRELGDRGCGNDECRGIVERCRESCYKEMCCRQPPVPHISEWLPRGLTIKQIGAWCRETVIEKPVMGSSGGEMIMERMAYLPLIVPPWAFEDTLTSAASFYVRALCLAFLILKRYRFRYPPSVILRENLQWASTTGSLSQCFCHKTIWESVI